MQPTIFTASLTKVTVGAPQASVATTDPGVGAGTIALHPASVTFAGQVMVGGVVSTVLVMVCVQVAVLPQASVAWYLLVVVSIQPARLTTSLMKVMVGV